MTTNEGTPVEEPQAQAETTDEAAEQQNAGPHAHIKTLESENKQYRQRLLRAEVKDLGLDPEIELGKAILKTFTGDPLDGAAVAAFAKEEYGYEKPATEPDDITERGQEEQRIENVSATSESVTPPIRVPDIAAAQALLNDPEASEQQLKEGLGVVMGEISKMMNMNVNP